MKFLRVTKEFRDKENEEKLISPPEIIERSNKRVDYLVKEGYGEEVSEEEAGKKE